MAVHRVSVVVDGKEFILETGKLAKLANGAVQVRVGDTIVLVTVCAGAPRPDIDFLPLTVEYREKTAAAGKIPGGFFKREARPSEKEILCCRLIDRPIRPNFPKTWRSETQIVAGVYSSDQENEAGHLAMTAASAALMISDIPFNGPISEVTIGRIDGAFVINPTYAQLEQSDLDITVAGSDTSIAMVEGSCKEVSEELFLQAIEVAHDAIRLFNAGQRQLAELAGKAKRDVVPEVEIPEQISSVVNTLARPKIIEQIRKNSIKEERSAFRAAIETEVVEAIRAAYTGATPDELKALEKTATKTLSKAEKEEMRKMILAENRRLDGRSSRDIRAITCEAPIMPRTHGSALFTRGETQSLTTITLGTKDDEQMIDGLLPTQFRRFLLHYNFPPFSTGEAGRMTGVSRREIGHGNLAERALQYVLPAHDDFPYVIRIVSDILESNGSSSMATVCAGSLGMYDAGVPITKPVAGIAMGLIKEGDDVAILSDILGDEDFLGDMDFKVAGTPDGITACQMDIKIEGISLEIMRNALNQAKEGRMHILGKMNECLDAPRADLSQYAPRLTTIMIPIESIGAVIGPGGETIRGMTREFGVEINIEDDGKVVIAALSQEAAQLAINKIMAITRPPEVGAVYKGIVKEVREGLGAIIEFLPKTKGLLHISQISYDRVENVGDVIKQGDQIEVKLLEIQSDGKFRLSRKAMFEPPEGYVEPEFRGGRSGGGDRDRRGGGGGDRRGGGDRDRRGGDDRRRDGDGNRDGGNRR